MAVESVSSKLLSEVFQRFYLSGDASSPKVVAWVDMADFDTFLAALVVASGGGATAFRIMASAQPDGSNPVEVKAWAPGASGLPDAVGDQGFLEATHEEIAQASPGAKLRYVGAEITNTLAGDNTVVGYTLRGLVKKEGLTQDVIA